MIKRFIASLVCVTFILTNFQYAQAQPSALTGPANVGESGRFSIDQLPVPGSMISTTAAYVPLTLKGMIIHPENAFKFDFLMDTGHDRLKGDALSDEALKVMKYFLTALTIPEDDLWVNLSPYEKERIIQNSFGQTMMGRDLLAQDYILKQLTASLIYPEKSLGKEFWQEVYSKAAKEYGTTQIPVNTFNKVWIVPAEAMVWEHEGKVLIVRSHLKVMLEEDYLALEKSGRQPGDMASAVSPSRLPSELGLNVKASQGNNSNAVPTNTLGSQIVRNLVLPVLEKEVNEGKNFAQLRQMYQAMILATWYKRALKTSILNKVYADKSKIKGLTVRTQNFVSVQDIYQRYLQAFKKGAFNYIKEDVDPATGGHTIPRKYFSGGFSFTSFSKTVLTVLTGTLLSLSVLQQQAVAQTVNQPTGGYTFMLTVQEIPRISAPELQGFKVIAKDKIINGIKEAKVKGHKYPATVDPDLLYAWCTMMDDPQVFDSLQAYLGSLLSAKGNDKINNDPVYGRALKQGVDDFFSKHPVHHKFLKDIYKRMSPGLQKLFTKTLIMNAPYYLQQGDCLFLWSVSTDKKIREEALKVWTLVMRRDINGEHQTPDAAMQSNVNELVTKLSDEKESIRRSAMKEIDNLRMTSQQMFGLLQKALDINKGDVREWAVGRLGPTGKLEAIVLLLDNLRKEKLEGYSNGIFIMLAAEGSLKILNDKIIDKEEILRIYVTALNSIADDPASQGIIAILEALRDLGKIVSGPVKDEAITALSRFLDNYPDTNNYFHSTAEKTLKQLKAPLQQQLGPKLIIEAEHEATPAPSRGPWARMMGAVRFSKQLVAQGEGSNDFAMLGQGYLLVNVVAVLMMIWQEQTLSGIVQLYRGEPLEVKLKAYMARYVAKKDWGSLIKLLHHDNEAVRLVAVEVMANSGITEGLYGQMKAVEDQIITGKTGDLKKQMTRYNKLSNELYDLGDVRGSYHYVLFSGQSDNGAFKDFRFSRPGLYKVGRLSDAAMTTYVKANASDELGGISLNAGMLDLQIKRDGSGMPLAVSQQSLDILNIQGFEAQIIGIKPADLSAIFR